MQTFFLILITCAITICSAISHANTPIFEAVYKGEYSGLNVETTRTLTLDESTQVFTLNTKAKALFASIKEKTVFSLNNTQIVPLTYEYKRSVFGKKKQQSLFFDWKEKHATGYKNGERRDTTLPLSLDTLDETTFQVQLQIDAAKLSKNANNNLSKALNYSYIKPFKHKHYTFYNHGLSDYTFNKEKTQALLLSTEPLNINNSTVSNIKNSTSTQNPDKTIHVWLLPAYNHVIGKIEFIDEDDDNYMLTLSDYSFNSNLINKITP